MDELIRDRWMAEVQLIGNNSIYESRGEQLRPQLDQYRRLRQKTREHPGVTKDIEEFKKTGTPPEEYKPLLNELLEEEKQRDYQAAQESVWPSEEVTRARLNSPLYTPYNVWLESRRTGTNAVEAMRKYNHEPSPVAMELLQGDMPSPGFTFLPPNYADDRKFLGEPIQTPYVRLFYG